MPQDGAFSALSLLQAVFRQAPSAVESLIWLAVILAGFLGLAIWAVERREYVLEQ
jgi:hypothetical protein